MTSVFSELDNEDFCNQLLEKHGCKLMGDSENGWVLDEPKGCFEIGMVQQSSEALKAGAVYVHLYYEKGVEYPLATHCALGFIGHILSVEQLGVDNNNKSDEHYWIDCACCHVTAIVGTILGAIALLSALLL